MWFSFWRSRERFSLDELRYLTEQLQKVHIVNDANKDFVIEALRSIAELITYGDQHDPSFFEFFMEKQIMGEFVRVLKMSRPTKVSLQLLQTMSIMIQNLKSEHAIYYIFSNEHINHLITYSFDFRNEELLSYYISFLRAVSGKLNKHTISLLVKTENDEIVSFPLYTEAIRFSFHEESMIRIAIRALTLNVYHVGDAHVNKFVSKPPWADYFTNLVKYFRKRCLELDSLASHIAKNLDSHPNARILSAIDEIEDSLYYFSDVISSGIPDLGRLIADKLLEYLIFPLLLPTLGKQRIDAKIGINTSYYLLCCILRIVKTKELASTVAAALFCLPETFVPKPEAKPNGYITENLDSEDSEDQDSNSVGVDGESLSGQVLDTRDSSSLQARCSVSPIMLREVLLSYIVNGEDVEVVGSLSLLATFLQTKELDESLLDGLGILPQRKQHKKLLFEALVGDGSDDEEQLFSPKSTLTKDDISTELDRYLKILKDKYGMSHCCGESRLNPRAHRYQVLDALVSLFCRSSTSADTLWAGGWLLRQLLPHGQEEFNSHHLTQLKDSHNLSVRNLLEEIKRSWSDLLIAVLKEEWKNCKRAVESPSAPKGLRSLLMPSRPSSSGGESSLDAGEQMCEMVKVFVLQHQLLIFFHGGCVPEQPPIESPANYPVNIRAKSSGLDDLVPKPGHEINIVNSIPCRIAFERGKERHFSFLAVSKGISGWLLLAEELPYKQQFGVIRVIAPLSGSSPRIDDKHQKWLHLRIRPSCLPSLDPSRFDSFGRGKGKVLVDGRWTLAFRDEQACKLAESMIIEELQLQQNEVHKRLKPLLQLDLPGNAPDNHDSSGGAPG